MKRIKLVVSYDGTNYCGWQEQPNGLTIEEVLNRELSAFLKEDIHVIGASRTDSGVHALGNIAVFDTETKIPADKICFALNTRLPEDIVIQSSCEVDLNYHPRKINSVKTYEYKILNRTFPEPLLRLNTHFVYMPLDVSKMKKAAEYLVGEHDFVSFCSRRNQAEDTIRTLYEVSVEKTGDVITIRLSGNGFLYNMVRIIAGTLMKVGLNIYPPEHIKEILLAEDRDAAGPKAPAKGLTLVEIAEKKELEPVIHNKEARFDYTVVQEQVLDKGKALVAVDYIDGEKLSQVLVHAVRQQFRNGASSVYVCDRTSKLIDGTIYDDYKFELMNSAFAVESFGNYINENDIIFNVKDCYNEGSC